MTTTNIQTRQPSKMDYASPVQFRFKIAKLPQVEFFIQSVNVPGISLGQAIVPTPLYNYPVPGDEISFQPLDISFLVDENLNNYKEVHDWISKHGVRYFNELTNMAQLTEEVGEVARIIARRYGEQSEKESDKAKDLGEELSDVLFVVLCLANQTGTDLQTAFDKKMNVKRERDHDRHQNNEKLK